MLKPYSVGTEKEKIVYFLPKEDELLPLREMKIISTQKMMKVALKRDRKSKKRLRVENEDNFFGMVGNIAGFSQYLGHNYDVFTWV